MTATDKGTAGLAAAPYSYDGGSTWTTINTQSFDTNQMITIKVKDANDNIATKTIALQIDKDVPSEPTITSDGGNGTWTADPAICTITDGADPAGGSGIDRTEYQFDGGNWIPYTTPITITTVNTLSARTIDKAGNISPISTITIQVDQIAPDPPDYYVEDYQVE